MFRQIEVIQSVDNIEPLTDLWTSPYPEALKADWTIPVYVKIGLASQNQEKIGKVKDILKERGGSLAASVSAPEEAIKEFLWEESQSIKGSRVANLAGMKSLSGFKGESAVTHCLALDTDVMVLGAYPLDPDEPLGRPETQPILIHNLRLISGRTLDIKTAAALANVRENRILAIEEVRILLKLREFTVEEYLEKIGTGLIGQIPGAIDFADQKSIAFLDLSFPVQVSRMIADSEQDTRKLVMVDPKAAPTVLGDYFRGYPAHLINWVIFNGLKAKFYQSFPL